MENVIEVAVDLCTQENLLDNTSASNTSESEDDKILLEPEPKRRRKIEGYIESVVPEYSNETFKEHFRLSRSAVKNLLQKHGEEWMNSSGRPKIDFSTALLVTLWTLATQDSLRSVADRFGLSIGHTHRIFIAVCQLFFKNRNLYIKWPNTEQEQSEVVDGFKKLTKFPGVLGCVDGTHVAIPKPTRNDSSYYNRKGYHSIILQGVCDHNQTFLDVYVGWPGSVHDARVWKASRLYRQLRFEGLYNDSHHILGDSAYPLDNFLMKPYKDNGHLSEVQKEFNTELSRCRVIIERAFGRLKGSFRRLRYLHCFNISAIKFIIITACIFHNISISEGALLEECETSEEESLAALEGYDFTEESISGLNKRDSLAQYIYSNKT